MRISSFFSNLRGSRGFREKNKLGNAILLAASLSLSLSFSVDSFASNSLLKKYKVKKVEVVPNGVTTSYNPVKVSYFTRTKFNMDTPLTEYVDYRQQREFTLAELIQEGTKLLTPENVVNDLPEFLDKDHFRADAQHWEGTCHRWGGWHGSDKAVKLATTSGGFICGDLHIDNVDVAEYLTAVYPGVQEAWYGTRTEKFGKQDEVNAFLIRALNTVGYTSFSPVEADEVFMKYLGEKKQRVVTDVDPNDQVWNQPTYSWSRESVRELNTQYPMLNMISMAGTTGVIQSKDYIGNSNFYIGKNPAAQRLIEQVDEIDKFIISTYVTMELHNNLYQTYSIHASTDKIPANLKSSASAEIQNIVTAANDEIETSINKLIEEKDKLWEAALASGIKLKDNLEAVQITGKLGAMYERGFRDGTPNTRESDYTFYVIKDTKTDRIYSKWAGERATGNMPDFVWVPKCNDDVCMADAGKVRKAFNSLPIAEKRTYSDAGYKIATANLYEMIDRCLSADEATKLIPKLMQMISKIGDNVYVLHRKDRNVLKEMYNRVVGISKIRLKGLADLMSKRIAGIAVEERLDKSKEIVFVDWDEKSGKCVGNYESKQKEYPNENCRVSKDSEFKNELFGCHEVLSKADRNFLGMKVDRKLRTVYRSVCKQINSTRH